MTTPPEGPIEAPPESVNAVVPIDSVEAISALGEPTRRATYDWVVEAGDWVSRDQAAAALGLERGTAAHQLDRLATDGLLDVEFRRLSGRTGPGAGRTSKLYRRAARTIDVSLPPRSYEMAARMFADASALAIHEHLPIHEALDRIARQRGESLAEVIRMRLDNELSGSPRQRFLIDALEELGYEPMAEDDGSVVLRNCPFHQVAQDHTEMVCGMNLCLLRSALEGVGDTGLEARLEPESDCCCVRFHPAR